MIRTFLDLHVTAGHADALVDVFARNAILDNSVAQPGCESAELTVSEDGRLVTVTATWDSREAYGRWTGRSDRGDLTEQINAHLDEPIGVTTVGRVHRVALVGADTPDDGENG